MIDFKDRKIQIIAGILLIVVLVGGYFLARKLLTKSTNIPPNAVEVLMAEDPEDTVPTDQEPYDIRILNLSESSFSVFFRTKEPVSAFIRVGQNRTLKWKALDKRVNDEKDTTKFYNHLFLFSDPAAKAESTYQYLIEINGTRYDNDGDLYSVNMAPLLSSPPAVIYLELYSSLASESNNKDAIIIVNNKSSNLTVESGYGGDLLKESSAILSLGSLRNLDKTAYITPTKIDIELFDGTKRYSSVELLDFDPDSVYNLVLR